MFFLDFVWHPSLSHNGLGKDVPSSSLLSPLSPSVKRGCVVSEGRLTSFSTQTFPGLWLVPSLRYWPLIGCYQPPSSSGLRVPQDTTRLRAASEGSVTGRLLIMDNTDYILWADTGDRGSSLTLCHCHHVIRKLSITCQVRGWMRGGINKWMKLIHVEEKEKLHNFPVKIKINDNIFFSFSWYIAASTQRTAAWHT